MTYLTRQEILDRVVAHSRDQVHQAVDESGVGCMYRAPDGARCFIGCLIPDSRYRTSFEGKGVNKDILKAAGIVVSDMNFASQLQGIHDNDHDNWPEALAEFAADFNLTVPA